MKRIVARRVSRAGFARRDLGAFAHDLPMFGWADPSQRIEGTRLPLFARALVLENAGGKAAFVCLDLGAVTGPLRARVLDGLARGRDRGLGAHNLMLSATHTHSGPGGLSPYGVLHAADGGFRADVLDQVARAALHAIAAADDALEPATLAFAAPEAPLALPVAFNRSLWAFARNREVARGGRLRAEEATYRVAPTLVVRDQRDRPLGLVQWLASHGTCLHREHRLVDPDNKGRAALALEAKQRAAGRPDFVALFAQESCGDVTPNGRWDPARRVRHGEGADDVSSAEVNAACHVRLAEIALAEARPSEDDALGGRTVHLDLSDAEIAPAHRAATGPGRTAAPRLGFAFTLGTEEGPGPLAPARGPIRSLSRAQAWLQRLGARRAAGSRREQLGPFPLQTVLQVAGDVPSLRYLAHLRMADALEDLPLVPRVLPVQWLRLGPVSVLGMPCEVTTIAGLRLRRALAGSPGFGVIASLSNDYAMYCGTPEEHGAQSYEGAATLYGPGTLGAYQTIATRLAAAGPCPAGDAVEGPTPSLPSEAALTAKAALAARLGGPSPVPPCAPEARR